MAKHSFRKTSCKDAAVSFLKLAVKGQIREAYAKYVAEDMRHHNLSFAGDSASLEKAMEENHTRFPHKVIDVRHAIEEGDLVAVHSHLRLQATGPSIAVVHIFRFEGDRIAELWDIGQEVPEQSPNANGMF